MKNTIIIGLLSILLLVSSCSKTTTESTSKQPIQTTTQLATIPTTKVAETTAKLVKEFTVEADDKGLYPSSVAVSPGDNVRINFKIRKDGVYYGGLDFRSGLFKVGGKAGDTVIAEFIADKTFSYTSYWPKSNVKKADGMITVN